MRLYYMTDVAELILQEGFGPGGSTPGFAIPTSRGGYVSDRPVAMDEGAMGEQLLEFGPTHGIDVRAFGSPRWLPVGGREWCVPATLLNALAVPRLLEGDEADAAWLDSWLGPDQPVRSGRPAGGCSGQGTRRSRSGRARRSGSRRPGGVRPSGRRPE